MEKEKHHIVPYRTYVYILLGLVVLTFGSIEVTSIDMGGYSVMGAMIFSSIKSLLVLSFFMHLKLDKSYFRIMVGFVVAVFLALILITFLDYYYR